MSPEERKAHQREILSDSDITKLEEGSDEFLEGIINDQRPAHNGEGIAYRRYAYAELEQRGKKIFSQKREDGGYSYTVE